MERRRYDEDFKSEAVRLIKEGGRKVSEVSRNLGIHENMLYKWKKSLTDDGEDGYTAEEKAELRKLKKQLRDVTEGRDMLKKAMDIFSKAPI
ncbi:MAG: transposase [Nitrospirota bacterium]